MKQKKGWLRSLDWDRYDMKEPIMKTPMSHQEVMALVRGIYSAFWTPEFVWRKLKEGLTSGERFRYYLWFGLKYFSRRADFRLQEHKEKSLTDFLWRGGRVIFGFLADLARK